MTANIIIAGNIARLSFFFMELVGFSDKFYLPFQRGKRGTSYRHKVNMSYLAKYGLHLHLTLYNPIAAAKFAEKAYSSAKSAVKFYLIILGDIPENLQMNV